MAIRFSRGDALLTAQVQVLAIHADRSPHRRLASRLRRSSNLRFGQRASISRGQARVPANAPVPGDRADERRVPWLRQGSHRAARMRRA